MVAGVGLSPLCTGDNWTDWQPCKLEQLSVVWFSVFVECVYIALSREMDTPTRDAMRIFA